MKPRRRTGRPRRHDPDWDAALAKLGATVKEGLDSKFLELRIDLDVMGRGTLEQLQAWAAETGRQDLVDEAALSAEEFAALVTSRGGSYELPAMRIAWSLRLSSRDVAATQRGEKLLTAEDVRARYPNLTYRAIWTAEVMGLLHPVRSESSAGPAPAKLTFRAFMARDGWDAFDASWAPEDVVAWFMDEQEPPE